MATQEAKPDPALNVLFTQLAEPFDLSEIKWRVTHTNKDGSRGAVIAFADPRAYTDRLNRLFTPAGWTSQTRSPPFPPLPGSRKTN